MTTSQPMKPKEEHVLSDAHRAMIVASGISPEVAHARGYRTATVKAELKRLGFSDYQIRVPALLVPIWGVTGEIVTYQLRPDEPRIKDGKRLKYETPTDSRMALDVPPLVRAKIGDPTVPLFITEGARKADSAASKGLVCIAFLGVWNWRGSNGHGGRTALPDWEAIALNDRRVYIVFDSDVNEKPEVYKALVRLKAFLESRKASVRVVYLPSGPRAIKVGLDDYLAAGHSVDDLLGLAQADLRSPPAGEERPEYEIADGALWWRTEAREGGEVRRRLTNFEARILKEIDERDGVESTRFYEVEARHADHAAKLRVTAREFDGLAWTADLASGAYVEPGQTNRERAAVAIRALSQPVPRAVVFAHLGWTRVGGEPFYLSRSGGIGAAGLRSDLTVRLPPDLESYDLPAPPIAGDLVEAIRASIGILNVAGEGGLRITAPLLGAVYRAPLGHCGLTVWLAGGSGVGKTTLAALAQQHWGRDFGLEKLPGSWSSTGNALESLAFTTKDTLLVVDDYAPLEGRVEADRQASAASRVLRNHANGAVRGRCRPDGTRHPARPLRGLLLSTGEDLPRGHSIRGRTVIVEVLRGTFDFTAYRAGTDRNEALEKAQAAGRSGVLAACLSGYVRWLAGRFEETAARVRELEEREARLIVVADGHARAAGNLAALWIGLDTFSRFALEVGAVTVGDRARFLERGEAGLRELAKVQATHHTDTEPAERFVAAIRSAVSSGQAHLAGADGGPPDAPGRFGWRVDPGPREGATRGQGDRIGWIVGTAVYLEPQAAHRMASRLMGAVGESLVSRVTLGKRLAERGWLAGRDETRGTLTVRRTLAGNREEVWQVETERLFPTKEESAPREVDL